MYRSFLSGLFPWHIPASSPKGAVIGSMTPDQVTEDKWTGMLGSDVQSWWLKKYPRYESWPHIEKSLYYAYAEWKSQYFPEKGSNNISLYSITHLGDRSPGTTELTWKMWRGSRWYLQMWRAPQRWVWLWKTFQAASLQRSVGHKRQNVKQDDC